MSIMSKKGPKMSKMSKNLSAISKNPKNSPKIRNIYTK